MIVIFFLNRVQKNIFFYIFFCFLLAKTTQTSFALDFVDLKGFDEHLILKSEFEYLNPVHAYNQARLGTLINIYHYPNTKAGTRYDAPSQWDPVEQLVQSLFHAPVGSNSPVFLNVSPLGSKCGKFLSNAAIGIVLNELHKNSEVKEKLTVDALKKKIEIDLGFQEEIKKAKSDADYLKKKISEFESAHSELLECDQKLESLKKEKEDLAKQKKTPTESPSRCQSGYPLVKNNTVSMEGDCSPITKEFIKRRLEEIGSHSKLLKSERSEIIEKLLKENEEYKQLQKDLSKVTYSADSLKGLLSRVLNSWKSEGLSSAYPKNMTAQILLSLAWLKTPRDKKRDFAMLYEKIEGAIVLEKLDLLGNWLNVEHPQESQYSIDDLLKVIKKINDNPEQRLEIIKKNPVIVPLLAFYEEQIPQIGYSHMQYITEAGEKVSFSDCMDSSLLNFLAIVSRNENNNLDLSVLPKHDLEPIEGLKEFVDTFKAMSDLETPQAHEKWARIVSGLEKVTYVRPQKCELETEVDTIFLVLEHLLGFTFNPTLSRSEKMDILCQKLSRPAFNLDWSLSEIDDEGKKALDESNTNVSLFFKINEENAFIWKILRSHSEIYPIHKNEKNIKLLLPELLKEAKSHPAITGFSVQNLYWADPQNVSLSLYREKKEKAFASFQMASIVRDPLSMLLEFLKVSPPRLNSAFRLISTLPQDDLYTQINIAKLFYKYIPDKMRQEWEEEFLGFLEKKDDDSKIYALNHLLSSDVDLLSLKRIVEYLVAKGFDVFYAQEGAYFLSGLLEKNQFIDKEIFDFLLKVSVNVPLLEVARLVYNVPEFKSWKIRESWEKKFLHFLEEQPVDVQARALNIAMSSRNAPSLERMVERLVAICSSVFSYKDENGEFFLKQLIDARASMRLTYNNTIKLTMVSDVYHCAPQMIDEVNLNGISLVVEKVIKHRDKELLSFLVEKKSDILKSKNSLGDTALLLLLERKKDSPGKFDLEFFEYIWNLDSTLLNDSKNRMKIARAIGETGNDVAFNFFRKKNLINNKTDQAEPSILNVIVEAAVSYGKVEFLLEIANFFPKILQFKD